jgi:hypothetical protein
LYLGRGGEARKHLRAQRSQATHLPSTNRCNKHDLPVPVSPITINLNNTSACSDIRGTRTLRVDVTKCQNTRSTDVISAIRPRTQKHISPPPPTIQAAADTQAAQCLPASARHIQSACIDIACPQSAPAPVLHLFLLRGLLEVPMQKGPERGLGLGGVKFGELLFGYLFSDNATV